MVGALALDDRERQTVAPAASSGGAGRPPRVNSWPVVGGSLDMLRYATTVGTAHNGHGTIGIRPAWWPPAGVLQKRMQWWPLTASAGAMRSAKTSTAIIGWVWWMRQYGWQTHTGDGLHLLASWTADAVEKNITTHLQSLFEACWCAVKQKRATGLGRIAGRGYHSAFVDEIRLLSEEAFRTAPRRGFSYVTTSCYCWSHGSRRHSGYRPGRENDDCVTLHDSSG